MACGRAPGGEGVGYDLGGVSPEVVVGCEVAMPLRPLLPHGLFPEEARVVGRDHTERISIEDGRRVGGGGARRPVAHGICNAIL